MSDQEINIAIAEVVGWWGNIKFIDGIPFGRPPKITSEYIELPDYCGDLNAMHEAEETLQGKQRLEYAAMLNRVAGRDRPNGIGAGCFVHIHANARQRAEAFLRTIGKWREEV